MLCVRAAARKSSAVAVTICVQVVDFQSGRRFAAADGRVEKRETVPGGEDGVECTQVFVRWMLGLNGDDEDGAV